MQLINFSETTVRGSSILPYRYTTFNPRATRGHIHLFTLAHTFHYMEKNVASLYGTNYNMHIDTGSNRNNSHH